MREAVIVSYARTGLAKSGRGGFNITPPMSLAAHAIHHAVDRAGVEKDYVEDCYLGNCAHGAPNIGRLRLACSQRRQSDKARQKTVRIQSHGFSPEPFAGRRRAKTPITPWW